MSNVHQPSRKFKRMKIIWILAMVTTMVYNIPLETRLYPRIMARGIHTGRLIFYEGNRRLTLNQGVQIPKI